MSSRVANGLGALACAGLLAFAYYAQVVLRLTPCPLCIFQRVGIFVQGSLFAAAALAAPRGWGRRVFAALIALAALATAGVAIRHLYIQSLPPGTMAACGASLDFMLKVFPLAEVLTKVLTGSGECAQVTWRLLGLSMPGWVLIAALALGALGVFAGFWANAPRRGSRTRS